MPKLKTKPRLAPREAQKPVTEGNKDAFTAMPKRAVPDEQEAVDSEKEKARRKRLSDLTTLCVVAVLYSLLCFGSPARADQSQIPMECLGKFFAALYTYDAYVKIDKTRDPAKERPTFKVNEYNKASRNYRNFRDALLDCFESRYTGDCQTLYQGAQDTRREMRRLRNEYFKLEEEERRQNMNRQNPEFQSDKLSRLGGQAIDASSKFHERFGELLNCLR